MKMWLAIEGMMVWTAGDSTDDFGFELELSIKYIMYVCISNFYLDFTQRRQLFFSLVAYILQDFLLTTDMTSNNVIS